MLLWTHLNASSWESKFTTDAHGGFTVCRITIHLFLSLIKFHSTHLLFNIYWTLPYQTYSVLLCCVCGSNLSGWYLAFCSMNRYKYDSLTHIIIMYQRAKQCMTKCHYSCRAAKQVVVPFFLIFETVSWT